MARGGGRSGGGRSFGGGSRSSFGGGVRRSSSGRSSLGGGRSSFSGGRNDFRIHSRPSAPRPYYGGRRTTHVHYHTGGGYGGYSNRATSVGGGGGTSGCLTVIVMALVFIVLIAILSGGFNTTNTNYIEDDVLEQYAEDAYIEEFGNKDGYLIVVCTEDADGANDVFCSKYRGDVSGIMSHYDDRVWEAYNANYNDDLGVQLGMTLSTVAAQMEADGVEPLNGGLFDRSFYKDEIDWVDSDSKLKQGGEDFFDASGIQVRIRLVEYKSFVGDYVETTNGLTKVSIGFIIAAAVVAVVWILFKWWQARKKQKNIEDENTIKILNTPLESFGDKELAETMKNYDTGDE